MNDFDKITDPATRDMLDLPALPKRRAGRPPSVLAPTFDAAMAALKPREQQFVRHVLSDKPFAEAYRLTSDAPTTARSAQVAGSKMGARDGVKHALKLGREQGAKQAVAGIKRDLNWADGMLAGKIVAAEKAGQHTAVSSLVQQHLKLHGLLIERQQIEQASLTVNISGVDTSRLVPRVDDAGVTDEEPTS